MIKSILTAVGTCLVCLITQAQDFSGIVKYNRVTDPTKMMVNNPNADRMRAQFGNFAEQARRPVVFLLTVKNKESVYKADKSIVPEENTVEINGERRTFQRRLPKDETYYNLESKKYIKYEEYAQQPFQVAGDMEVIRWKLDPTKTRQILGHECMMATASESERRNIPVPGENGQISFKDSLVTNQITAWFTDAIASEAGPERYNGLPGLILALDINDGLTTYVATNIEARPVTTEELAINTKGKKVSPEQLKKIKADHMAEQAKNRAAGGFGGGFGGGGFRGGNN